MVLVAKEREKSKFHFLPILTRKKEMVKIVKICESHSPLLICCSFFICSLYFGSFSGLPTMSMRGPVSAKQYRQFSSTPRSFFFDCGKKGQCDSNMCLPIEDSDERMESQELSFFRHQSPPKGLLLLQTRQKDSERRRPILSQDSKQAKLTTYSRVSKTISVSE